MCGVHVHVCVINVNICVNAMFMNSVSVSYLYTLDVVVSIMNVLCAYCGGVQGEFVKFVEIDCT